MIETARSAVTWDAWCAEAGVRDVFWSWDHLVLWADESGCVPVGVRYSGPGGVVLWPVLVADLGRVGAPGHVDVRTAYDFGGPLRCGEIDTTAFETAWDDLLRDWGAVTSFHRLHPLRDLVPLSHAQLHAHNITVDLTAGHDAARAGYHSSFRRALRQGDRLSDGPVTVERDPTPRQVAAFCRLYTATMDHVGASAAYRFSDRALSRLMALSSLRLVTAWVDGTPAAMALLLTSGEDLFYHLGCSDHRFRDQRPNHRVFDTLVRVGCAEGRRRLHLGGGSESLRRFKGKIGSQTVPYRVVKRIVDPDTHGRICAGLGLDPSQGMFPPWHGR